MVGTILLWVAFSIFGQQEVGQVQLSLKNIDPRRGSIRVAIYDNRTDFENQQKPVHGMVIKDLTERHAEVELPIMAFGTYAIAVYQDKNNNDRLDTNLLGIPKEPYAFSNNPVAKWSPATFEESKFNLRKGKLNLMIELKEWNEY